LSITIAVVFVWIGVDVRDPARGLAVASDSQETIRTIANRERLAGISEPQVTKLEQKEPQISQF